MRSAILGVTFATWLLACGSDSVGVANEDETDSSARDDGGMGGSPSDARDSGHDVSPQLGPGTDGCDLTGEWVTQQHTRNRALGVTQLSTSWSHFRIEQTGLHVRITEYLDCGYVARGSTDVALSDATLEAVARLGSNGAGTEGSFEPTAEGTGCELNMERIYTLRGANKERFLDAIWQVGDLPRDLSEFDLPTSESDGVEDWDEDGHEGITLLTGFGDRYTAQIDWYALSGIVPLADLAHSEWLGGEGVITFDYDERESVSAETAPLLRAASVPEPPGYGYWIRADELAADATGDHAELELCKRAQRLAVETLGDPPAP